MNNTSKVLLTMCAMLLFACGSSKKIEKVTKEYEKVIDSIKQNRATNVIDTLEIYKDRIVTQKVNNYIEVPIECDSLGKVKPISYKTNTGPVKLDFEVKDGKISLSTKIDSIVNSYEKQYRSKYVTDSLKLEQKIKEQYSKEVTEVKKITRFPWYWKLLMWVGGILVVAFLAWKVYKKINPLV